MQKGRRSACPIPGGRAPVGMPGCRHHLLPSLCSVLQEHRVRSLTKVDVSSSSLSLPTPELYLSLSSCLSPLLPASCSYCPGLAGFPLTVLNAALVLQEPQGSVMSTGQSWSHSPVLFILPARLQEAPAQAQPAALPAVWKRGEGGCTSTPSFYSLSRAPFCK